MFWLEILILLAVLVIGLRCGGIILGFLGGLGLLIVIFGFHMVPQAPPIDVMLIILSVVLAVSCLQVAGGMDVLINPKL